MQKNDTWEENGWKNTSPEKKNTHFGRKMVGKWLDMVENAGIFGFFRYHVGCMKRALAFFAGLPERPPCESDLHLLAPTCLVNPSTATMR